MAWIRTVPEGEAEGHLAKIYREAIDRAGKVFGILKVQSLDARILDASMRLYMTTTTHPRSPLVRWFRELVAVTVSRLNHCHY